MSPAAEPFPQKIVTKVQSHQFVEMREFLADNIALLQHLEAMNSPVPVQTVGPNCARFRDVSSLPTWIYCFLGYMAILTSDQQTRDQLAYARLIIREAQRHGGNGWLDYDRAFRQQLAADPSRRWKNLEPRLQAATMYGQAAAQPTFCTLCRGTDHTRPQCALTYLYPQPLRPPPQQRQAGSRVNQGAEICRSWNRGTCIFPGRCWYRHVCLRCHLPHRARDCPKTPEQRPQVQLTGPQPRQ